MPDPPENLPSDASYSHLLRRISESYTAGQLRAQQVVNSVITETYWQIGRDIVEFEQEGKARAGYGRGLILRLARDLTLRHGKGFSRSNVKSMRTFYLAYPKGQTASGFLTWSHYVELLSLDDELERGFYERQAIAEKWSVKELKRQKKTSLFLRLAAGKDKEAILTLSREGQAVAQVSH